MQNEAQQDNKMDNKVDQKGFNPRYIRVVLPDSNSTEEQREKANYVVYLSLKMAKHIFSRSN